jgi:hypothetical protein
LEEASVDINWSSSQAGLITTTDLINSTQGYPSDYVLETSGFTTSGDGGGAKWKQNGVIAQTPSQTPAQLANAIINDGAGNQWSLVHSYEVSIEQMGATDTDSSQHLEIQAAINSMQNTGGTIGALPREYRVDQQIIGYSNVSINVDKGCVFDFSNIGSFSDEPLIVYRGAVGSTTTTTQATGIGDNTITVSDSSIFNEGDLIEISNNAINGDWVDSSVAVRIGELQIVNEILSSTGVSISDGVMESFPYPAGTSVHKINSIDDVEIKNLKIIGQGRQQPSGSGDWGIYIFYGRDVNIENCNVEH